jgi:RNA polymerase sigma-70 factor (ECF subfamily)
LLGHSLEEIGALLELSVPSVKAALHRGRARLKEERAPPPHPSPSPVIAKYVALFNGRDFDGVRAMLADDVKLDVVSRTKREGRGEVGHYFTNYQSVANRRLKTAWLDGREVIAVFVGDEQKARYFIQLETKGDQVSLIRDFLHVPYIARDAAFEVQP